MKKNVFIIVACAALSARLAAQENSATARQEQKTEASVFTGVRPPDGLAYVFASREEKETSVPGKRSNVIEQIRKNQSDPEKVKLLRMELWRIDNATVSEPKSNSK